MADQELPPMWPADSNGKDRGEVATLRSRGKYEAAPMPGYFGSRLSPEIPKDPDPSSGLGANRCCRLKARGFRIRHICW